MRMRFAVIHVTLLGVVVGLLTGFDSTLRALIACAVTRAGIRPSARTPAFRCILRIASARNGCVKVPSTLRVDGTFCGRRPCDGVIASIELPVTGSLVLMCSTTIGSSPTDGIATSRSDWTAERRPSEYREVLRQLKKKVLPAASSRAFGGFGNFRPPIVDHCH